MQAELMDSQTAAATSAAQLSSASAAKLQGDIALAMIDRDIYDQPAFKTARAAKLYTDQVAPLVSCTCSFD